jgi:membrane protease YdiL (CAAX protease family)
VTLAYIKYIFYCFFWENIPTKFFIERKITIIGYKMKFNAEYDKRSGLVPIENSDPKIVKRLRIWNIAEPILVYTIALVVIWVSGLEASWLMPVFAVLALWALFISPAIHYYYEKDIYLEEENRNFWLYFFESRGMGSARRYFFTVDGEKPLYKKYFKYIAISWIIISLSGICTAIHYNEEFLEYLTDFGLGTSLITQIIVLISLLPILFILLFIGFSVMIRFDTIKLALKHLGIIIAIGIPYVLMFNLIFTIWPDLPYLTGDSAAQKLSEFTIVSYGSQFFGYIFWGYLQQLLFLGIFNTMLCRGFDITKPSGQILASFFTSMFFGLIHLPVFWLSFFTWFAGFFWSLYFMRSRNLWTMGVSHGALATLLNQLTPVPFSVGPKVVL